LIWGKEEGWPAIYRRRTSVCEGRFAGGGRGRHGDGCFGEKKTTPVAARMRKRGTAPASACDWLVMAAAYTRQRQGCWAAKEKGTARRGLSSKLAKWRRRWENQGDDAPMLHGGGGCGVSCAHRKRREMGRLEWEGGWASLG
jgi:hypothetical protein